MSQPRLDVEGATATVTRSPWALQTVTEVSETPDWKDSLTGLIHEAMMRPSPDLGWMFPEGKPPGAEWPDNSKTRLVRMEPDKVFALPDGKVQFDVRITDRRWSLGSFLGGGPNGSMTRSQIALRVASEALERRKQLLEMYLGEWVPVAISFKVGSTDQKVRVSNPDKAAEGRYATIDMAHPELPSKQDSVWASNRHNYLLQRTVWVETTQRPLYDPFASKPDLSSVAAFNATRLLERLPELRRSERVLAERIHRQFFDLFFVDGDPRGIDQVPGETEVVLTGRRKAAK